MSLSIDVNPDDGTVTVNWRHEPIAAVVIADLANRTDPYFTDPEAGHRPVHPGEYLLAGFDERGEFVRLLIGRLRLAGEQRPAAPVAHPHAEALEARADPMWCDLCGAWHAVGACPEDADPDADD